jgi:hypothetical protein
MNVHVTVPSSVSSRPVRICMAPVHRRDSGVFDFFFSSSFLGSLEWRGSIVVGVYFHGFSIIVSISIIVSSICLLCRFSRFCFVSRSDFFDDHYTNVFRFFLLSGFGFLLLGRVVGAFQARGVCWVLGGWWGHDRLWLFFFLLQCLKHKAPPGAPGAQQRHWLWATSRSSAVNSVAQAPPRPYSFFRDRRGFFFISFFFFFLFFFFFFFFFFSRIQRPTTDGVVRSRRAAG